MSDTHVCIQAQYLPNTMDCRFLGSFVKFFIVAWHSSAAGRAKGLLNYLTA